MIINSVIKELENYLFSEQSAHFVTLVIQDIEENFNEDTKEEAGDINQDVSSKNV